MKSKAFRSLSPTPLPPEGEGLFDPVFPLHGGTEQASEISLLPSPFEGVGGEGYKMAKRVVKPVHESASTAQRFPKPDGLLETSIPAQQIGDGQMAVFFGITDRRLAVGVSQGDIRMRAHQRFDDFPVTTP